MQSNFTKVKKHLFHELENTIHFLNYAKLEPSPIEPECDGLVGIS